jgi:hypothetical protein
MKRKKEETLLEKLGKIKAEIQVIQLWIDNASTNRIARIRYEKTKEIMKSLVEAHKKFFQRLKRLNRWE